MKKIEKFEKEAETLYGKIENKKWREGMNGNPNWLEKVYRIISEALQRSYQEGVKDSAKDANTNVDMENEFNRGYRKGIEDVIDKVYRTRIEANDFGLEQFPKNFWESCELIEKILKELRK